MQSVAHECNEVTENGTLKVFCNNVAIKEVPQDLNENTQYLDLSDNYNIKNLSPDTFKKYQSLTYLSLRNCHIDADIGSPYAGFKTLNKLEELDISGLQHKGAEKLYNLPLNLTILKINKTDIGDLVLTDLLNIEYVDASDNLKMLEFPIFNEYAKVKTVILLNVKLDHLVVTQIAVNCHIERLDLSIDFDGGSILLEPNKYCECINIHRWVKEFELKSNLRLSPHDLKCRRIIEDKSDLELCQKDETFNVAVNKRNKCLKLGSADFTLIWIIAGALILVLFGLILVVVFLDVKLYADLVFKRKKNKDEGQTQINEQLEQEQLEE